MAGSAKSTEFLLSSATVMIGPQNQLKSLNPAVHSIGLVKNMTITTETTKTELTQGVSNDVVSSIVTGNTVTVAGEVYEYTGKNIAYGLGLDATSGYEPKAAPTPLAANVAAGALTFKVTGDVTSTYVAGSFGYLQEGQDDQVHIFKISNAAFAAGETTVTIAAGYGVPTGVTFSSAAGRAALVHKIDADPSQANKSFAMKMTGVLPEGNTPVTVLFPKVKITKGFSLAFSTENFGNLPFEFSPYTPVPTDVGYDADFRQKMTVLKG
jgi:hypothetical protein